MNRPQRPSLKALKAFDAVSRHLHVKKAADELCVTPSAISHLIRQLEYDLGLTLVQRNGRNIKLTSAGEKLAPGIQHTFYSLASLIEQTQSHHDPNRLTVSLRPYFAAKWLSPRLSRFWRLNPDIELRLIHTTSTANFIEDRVDLSIEWLKREHTSTRHSLLIEGQLTPVLSPLMAGASKIKTPQDLLNCTLLRETEYDSWKDWFASAGLDYTEPQKTAFIDDSNVRYQAAIDGQGVELSCQLLIQDDLNSGLLLNPFSHSVSHFGYFLVEPEYKQTGTASEAFKKWILAETKSANETG